MIDTFRLIATELLKYSELKSFLLLCDWEEWNIIETLLQSIRTEFNELQLCIRRFLSQEIWSEGQSFSTEGKMMNIEFLPISLAEMVQKYQM